MSGARRGGAASKEESGPFVKVFNLLCHVGGVYHHLSIGYAEEGRRRAGMFAPVLLLFAMGSLLRRRHR